MLSTIFLFSGKVDVTQSLPYAKLNIAEIVREQRITKPYFSGVSDNGTEITLSAAYASSDKQDSDILNITDLSIILTSENAKTVRITAGLGVLDASQAKSHGLKRRLPYCNAGFLAQNKQFDSRP